MKLHSHCGNPSIVFTLYKLDLAGPLATVRLTLSEAMLIRAFAEAPGGRLKAEQIVEIFGLPPSPSAKSSLQVRIVRLRKKLYQTGADGAVIEAVRNVGYQFFSNIHVVPT